MCSFFHFLYLSWRPERSKLSGINYFPGSAPVAPCTSRYDLYCLSDNWKIQDVRKLSSLEVQQLPSNVIISLFLVFFFYLSSDPFILELLLSKSTEGRRVRVCFPKERIQLHNGSQQLELEGQPAGGPRAEPAEEMG